MPNLAKRVAEILDKPTATPQITRLTASDEAIVELAHRINRLDEAIREVAVEVDKLASGA